MPIRKLVPALGLTTVAALGAAALMPTLASAAECAPNPTSKAYSKVGDTADYSLAPGGDFETTAGWTLSGGATLASGNETLGWLKGSILPGRKSLSLPVGASATSPEFCVDESHPTFRFMAKPSSAMAGYKAVVIYRGENGATTSSQFTSSQQITWGEGSWSASKASPLAANIPLNGGTAAVRLQFISTGNPVAVGINFWGRFTGGDVGATSVDTVMVDPYRRG